jgi:hypothetical protein
MKNLNSFIELVLLEGMDEYYKDNTGFLKRNVKDFLNKYSNNIDKYFLYKSDRHLEYALNNIRDLYETFSNMVDDKYLDFDETSFLPTKDIDYDYLHNLSENMISFINKIGDKVEGGGDSIAHIKAGIEKIKFVIVAIERVLGESE